MPTAGVDNIWKVIESLHCSTIGWSMITVVNAQQQKYTTSAGPFDHHCG
jgi:hypothetical protein